VVSQEQEQKTSGEESPDEYLVFGVQYSESTKSGRKGALAYEALLV